MLIRSLELDNYRVIRSARIMLPESVIGIIGPNGAGKTTLVEAIAWALYGTGAARSGKDQIAAELAAPDDLCRVAVTFDIHGATYVVDRRLVGRGRRAEATICDAQGGLLAAGVSEVGAYVATLFGLDFKGFLTSFLARQQELNAFSDLAPSKRREHLATLLGVDRLDRAIADLRSDSRVQQAELGVLLQNLEHRAALSEELAGLSKALIGLEKSRDQTAGARDQAAARLKTSSDEYQAEQSRKDACSVIEGQLQGARSSLKHLQDRALQLEHEAADLTRIAAQAEKLKAETGELESLRRQREALADRKRDSALAAELDRTLADLDGRLKGAIAESDRLKTESAALAEQLSAFPINLSERLPHLETQLDQARQRYTDITSLQRGAASELKRLTERLDDMTTVGESVTCDRCGRAFGDDLPTIRAHFTAETTACRAELERLTGEQDRLKAVGEKLKADLADCRTRLQRQGELIRQRETGQARQKESAAQVERMRSQRGAMAHKRAALKSEPFDQAEFDRTNLELTRLEKLAGELNQLIGKLARQPVIAGELADTRSAAEKVSRDIAELERQRTEIGFEPARFERLAIELQAAQTSYDHLARQAAERERDHALAVRELELKSKQLAQFDETEARLEQVREAAYYGEKLQSLIKQFRTSVIANIRPSLAAISSRLMADMTDGRYSLVELDDEYNLQVMDNGRFYPVERFSGGEKDLANLCLRLAISQALTDAAGIDSAFVILDEIFGSQDDGRRELIFDALAGLKRRFAQIILVTHIEEIKNRVECLIEVRPAADGWSEVMVNG